MRIPCNTLGTLADVVYSNVASRMPFHGTYVVQPPQRQRDRERVGLLPCLKTLVTLRCELKTRPGLALGPLEAP